MARKQTFPRHLIAIWLSSFLLIPLVLLFPTPAAARAEEDAHLANADPDCDNPLPGQVAKLVDNDEIMLASATLGSAIYIDKLDDKQDGSKDLIDKWEWKYKNYSAADITTADLDGDTRDEVVMGFSTGGYSPGELGAMSLKNPEVNESSQLQFDSWSSTVGGYGYLGHVSVASGNLDGRLAGGDKADEVVLAFQDAFHQLKVVLLDGEADGGIKYLTTWYDTNHARTYILSVIQVAVGDVDSDGYDDDIVLAFVDGNKDVQVVVLKLNQNGGLDVMGWEAWTSQDRGDLDWESDRLSIDVAVGNFNDDATDEIAVAFRDHSKALQVMQVVYDPSGDTERNRVNSTGWWRDTGHGRNNVASVSLAAGDIDGDNYEEIISAFANSSNHLGLVTLDGESGSPRLRGSYGSSSGDFNSVSFLDLEAGDIDALGDVEVVIAFADKNDRTHVASFDDNFDCPCGDDNSSGLILRDEWSLNKDYYFPIGMALGDVNGDSIYGDYTDVCTSTQHVRVAALVGLPPVWDELNDEDSEIGYGKSSASEKESEQEFTTTYGSSATFDASFHFGHIEIGPVVTKDWENSITDSSATGDKIEVRDGFAYDGDGIVPMSGVIYYSYQYARQDTGALARVDVPVDYASDGKRMESYWNWPDGERVDAPTSWIPAYRSGWMDAVDIQASPGSSSQGAGSDFYDINGSGTEDFVFAWLDGALYYRFAWDMKSDGSADSWSSTYEASGFDGGDDGVGLGAAVTELNGNSTPELVLAWVQEVSGENPGAYLVGWDMDTSGQVNHWSEKKTIPHWIGGSTQGAGLDILDINGDHRPELFFGWIDNPADVNTGHYRVAWSLDSNGDSANWWIYAKALKGAFGPENAGLGLTLADMDGDLASGGKPELVAAWVRDVTGENQWAYAIGEQMDHNAYLNTWTPGHPVAVSMDTSTDYAGLASADLVDGNGQPELVVSWIDNPDGANSAKMSVGYFGPLMGEPDQYPSAVLTSTVSGEFQTYLYDHWWNVRGDLNWRWDEYNPPLTVSVGGAHHTWSVDKTHFEKQTHSASSSSNIDIAGEAKFMGIGVEGSLSHGFEKGSSQSLSWEKGWYMEGATAGLPITASHQLEYKYAPYTYMQTAMSLDGVEQAYMVVDHIVPYIGPVPMAERIAKTSSDDGPSIVPGAPLINSPSHPDSGTWYPSATVDFTWTQPGGDASTVDGYSWYLDRHADTMPDEHSQGLYSETTFDDFSDGLWYLHVRARDESGEWGSAGHRTVRLDGNPPQVAINLDPTRPADNGWYNSPVTATVTAEDVSTSEGQSGSGVASLEVSTDGVTWQAYGAPLSFDQERPISTLWARATDAVGHVSTPVTTTFGLDLSGPTSEPTPGCWAQDGLCAAEVFTDTMGNQHLRVTGEVDGALSSPKGVAISFDGEHWTPAQTVSGNNWAFESDHQVGAGCHNVYARAEDHAGNVEAPHLFTDSLVWLPREEPVLSGSRLRVTPDRVRPGDTVTISLVVRNGGYQEAWTTISVQLPAGVAVLAGSIPDGGVYDPDTRLVSWPATYLWPGDERVLDFQAQIETGQPAATLSFGLAALGTWPSSGECSAPVLATMQDKQVALTRTSLLSVEPLLDDGVDAQPPAAPILSIERRRDEFDRDIQLLIDADDSEDVTHLYIREWSWDAAHSRWTVRGESSWQSFSTTYDWTLSEDAGVKYVGVWLADAAGNVSSVSARSLVFANVLEGSPALADGERVQYRFPLQDKELAIFNLMAVAGNPHLTVWKPFSGFRPQYAAADSGYVDTVGFQVEETGIHLVEVMADGDSQYELLPGGDVRQASSSSDEHPATPEHPLTASDPLSAGAGAAPLPPGEVHEIYLPSMSNGS